MTTHQQPTTERAGCPILWAPGVPLAIVCVAYVALAGCESNATFVEPQPADQPLCIPNLDGVIDASELPVDGAEIGHYRVSAASRTPSVVTAGTVGSDGLRTWDWQAADPTDTIVDAQLTDPASYWFAAAFADAQFAVVVDRDATLLGLYRRDDVALWLLGIASREPAPQAGKTLMRYTEPVAVLRFPLRPGLSWVSVGKLSGAVVAGLPFAGTDRYAIAVQSTGRLELPAVTLMQAMRVQTRFSRTPQFGGTSVAHQVSLFFECAGEVGRVVAAAPEAASGAMTAQQWWRWHP